MHEEIGPDGATTTRRRSLNELSEEELQVLAEFLDDLSLIRGAMKSDVSGTLERIRMAAKLGVTAITIFMVLYCRIMAEKDQKETMREILVNAIEVFRSYVDLIAERIQDIGKLKAMEHVARAITQGFQAAGSAAQAGATFKAGSKVDGQIKQQKADIQARIKGNPQQEGSSGMMGEYRRAGGADPNYRDRNFDGPTTQGRQPSETAGDPFNYDPNRTDQARGKTVKDGNGKDTDFTAGQKGRDIDEGNAAAQQKRKEIDNAMIEYKNLDSQKMPLLQKEVFTYQAYAETYKGTIGALGELAQAGIAIEQSTLEAEKTIIEGAKELQARLLDTIYQALAESKDDSQKVYDYLIQWIQSMGQANPLSAAPRG